MVANVSQAFHDAIKQGVPQRALLLFDNYIFTNDDIAASAGLEFDEYFNSEQDLTIGLCPSSTLKFTVLNYENLFENFQGGPFEAYLGVMTAQQTYTRYEDELCRVVLPNGTVLSGHSTAPYLREDGVAAQAQPEYAVCSIVGFDGVYYLAGDEEQIMALLPFGGSYLLIDPQTFDPEQATASEASALSGKSILPSNAFLRHKARGYARRRVGVRFERASRMTREWQSGRIAVYEYVPLGVFLTDRPARVRVKMIEIDAYDRMSLFEETLDGFTPDLPASLSGFFSQLCAFYGVPARDMSGALNADLTVTEDMMPDLSSTTGRQLLAQIAQAMSGIARFDRTGALGIDWFADSDLVLDENDYKDFTPSEYTVPKITQLVVRNSDADEDIVAEPPVLLTRRAANEEEEPNAYIIQENPFLNGNQEAAEAIIARLNAMAVYTPGSVSWLTADWSYQPGDVAEVKQGDTSFIIPLFVSRLKWNSTAKTSVETTGSSHREPLPEKERSSYETSRNIKQNSKQISSVGQRVGVIEGSEFWKTRDSITSVVGKFSIDRQGNVVLIDGAELKLTKDGSYATVGTVEQIDAAKTEIEGELSLLDEAVEVIEGSTIWQERDAITSAVGTMTVDQNGVLHIKEGSGLKIDKYGTSYGVYDEDNLTAGLLVQKLSDGTTTTQISGDYINLTGYVTMTDLNAQKAYVDLFFSGTSTASKLVTNALETGSFTFLVDDGGSATRNSFAPGYIGIPGTNSPLPQMLILTKTDTAGNAQNYNLQHYHEIDAEEEKDSSGNPTGKINLTLGQVTSTEGTTNFNIADTQFYKDGVSAAKEEARNAWSISPSSLTFDADDIIIRRQANGSYYAASTSVETVTATDGERVLTSSVSVLANVTGTVNGLIDSAVADEQNAWTLSPSSLTFGTGDVSIQKQANGSYYAVSNAFKNVTATDGDRSLTSSANVLANVTDAIQAIIDENPGGVDLSDVTVVMQKDPDSGTTVTYINTSGNEREMYSEGSATAYGFPGYGTGTFYAGTDVLGYAEADNERSDIFTERIKTEISDIVHWAYNYGLTQASAEDLSGGIQRVTIPSVLGNDVLVKTATTTYRPFKNNASGTYQLYDYAFPKDVTDVEIILEDGQTSSYHGSGITRIGTGGNTQLSLKSWSRLRYKSPDYSGGNDWLYPYKYAGRGNYRVESEHTTVIDVGYIYQEGRNDGFIVGDLTINAEGSVDIQPGYDPDTGNLDYEFATWSLMGDIENVSISYSGTSYATGFETFFGSEDLSMQLTQYIHNAYRAGYRAASDAGDDVYIDVNRVVVNNDGSATIDCRVNARDYPQISVPASQVVDLHGGSDGASKPIQQVTLMSDGTTMRITYQDGTYTNLPMSTYFTDDRPSSGGADESDIYIREATLNEDGSLSVTYHDNLSGKNKDLLVPYTFVTDKHDTLYDSYDVIIGSSNWGVSGSIGSSSAKVSTKVTATVYGVKGSGRVQLTQKSDTVTHSSGALSDIVSKINIDTVRILTDSYGDITNVYVTIKGFGGSREGSPDTIRYS